MAVEIPIAYRQVGWMKCIVCSDFKTKPGTLWLGKTRAGLDETMQCPSCKGTGQVPRYQVINMLTGKEIDYEAHGRDEHGNEIQINQQPMEAHHVT